MPLYVKSRDYYDHLGRQIGFPVANQGDYGSYYVSYSLSFSVLAGNSNPIQVIGGSDLTFKLSDGTWEGIGIVSGDTVTFNLTDNDATSPTTISGSAAVLITNGNALIIDVAVPNDFTAMKGYVYTNKTPQALEFLFNLVPKTQTDGFESLIDNTVAVLYTNGLVSLGVGANQVMTQIGNRSGSIIDSCSVNRTADEVDAITGATVLNYTVEVVFCWHAYLKSFQHDYLFDVLTITPIVKASFFPLFNESGVYISNVFKLAEDGNSGFRDENFNQGIDHFDITSFAWTDSLGNPIGAYDFSQDSYFSFTVVSTSGFGGNFGMIFFNDISDTDSISAKSTNTIGENNHATHTILAQESTLTATTGQSFTSVLGVGGEQVTISDISISVVANTATVSGKITPNAAFIAKFSDDNNTEKSFAFLFRCETASFTPSNYSTTVNKTLWEGVGAIAPIVLGSLTVREVHKQDHKGVDLGAADIALIEDDNQLFLYAVGLHKNEVFTAIRLHNAVLNTTTGNFFYLETYNFDLDQTILTDGSQNIAFSQDVYFNMPATAPNSKILINKTLVDPPGAPKYYVDIHFPYLQRWEGWQPQSGVDVFFYNVANKDWRNYNNISGWQLCIIAEFVTDIGSYFNKYNYQIANYNHLGTLTHQWIFKRMNGQVVSNPLIGEPVYVQSIWTHPTAAAYTFGFGEITVEPYLSQPRKLISTEYVQGTQVGQPLQALPTAGDKLFKFAISPTYNQISFMCILDPNQLNTVNGISLTSRVHHTTPSFQERIKTDFPLVQLPNVPTQNDKPLICCECEPEKVLASFADSDLYKNDFTSVFHTLDAVGDTCVFKIYREYTPTTPLTAYGVTPLFPNDSKLVGYTFNWRDYLIHYGGGCYTIQKEITVAGLSYTIEIGKYKLFEYSEDSAEQTTRVIAQFNKEVQYEEFGAVKRADFTGSNFETCFRFNGYFGKWQPNPEVINQYAFDGLLRNAKIRYKGTYAWVMAATSICKYEYLVKKLLLFSSILKVSDYNFFNPNQNQEVKWCVLNDENSIEINYYDNSRKAAVTIGLKDYLNTNISRFNGSIEPLQGVSYELATIGTSGTGGVCTPVDVEVKNSIGTIVDSGLFPSGSGTATLNAPDATAVVKLSDGTIVTTDTIPSGISEDIIIPNPNVAEIKMDGVHWFDANAYATNNAYVKDSAGTTLAASTYTLSGNDVLIDDSEIQINGTAEFSVLSTATQNIILNDHDGNVVTVDTVTGNVVELNIDKDLNIIAPFKTSDTFVEFDIVTGSNGTISTDNTTGLSSVVYKVNATVVTLPFSIAVGDTFRMEFSAASADGVINLSGTYA